MEDKKWVTIYKFYDALEAQELEAVFNENSIPHKIISREDSAFDGLFKPSIGSGILQVREDHVEQSKGIISEYERRKKEATNQSDGKQVAGKIQPTKSIESIGKALLVIIFVLIAVGIIKERVFNTVSLQVIESIKRFEKDIKVNPKDVVAHESLAYIFFNIGDYGKSIYYYKKAIGLESNNYRFYCGLGAVYVVLENYQEAIVVLQKAIELNPKDELSYMNLGRAYRGFNMYELAVSTFQKALQVNPKSTAAYNGLSSTYYYKKDFNNMLASAQKEIELNSKDPKGFYNVGLAYYKLKLYPDAVAFFKKALDIDPAHVTAYYNLGIIYKEKGDRALMLEQYKKLKELKRNDLANMLIDDNQTSFDTVHF